MKKFKIFIIFVMLIMPANVLATDITKNITKDTTWTLENSPYVLIKPIEIEYGDTLTIEPGVVVQMPGAYENMFTLKGEIIAIGTEDNKITFDGGGNSTFFDATNSKPNAFANLDYCIIKDGNAFWKDGYGYFSLKNSEVENLSERSYLSYPENDVYIEYNEFKNIGGFTIEQGLENKVYIRHNTFDTKNPALPAYENYLIQNTASYENAETIVENNTFINMEGIVLSLPNGYAMAKMSAPNNNWGTEDTSIIDAMIYDKNDSNDSAGYINYLPITVEEEIIAEEIIEEVIEEVIEEKIIEEEEIIKKVIKEINVVEKEKGLTTEIDDDLSERLSGKILLQVEEKGEAWYVYPVDKKKYYLGRPSDAFSVMRNLGLGASHEFITKYTEYPDHVLGKILLDVELNGEAYYINPDDKKAYYLGRPADAFNVMRNLGLGISNENIRKIEVE